MIKKAYLIYKTKKLIVNGEWENIMSKYLIRDLIYTWTPMYFYHKTYNMRTNWCMTN